MNDDRAASPPSGIPAESKIRKRIERVDRKRVTLRPVEESDVDDILGWVNDPEIVGNLAAFAGKPLTREDELAWVRQVRTSTDEKVFTVLEAGSGRYLGQVGLHQIFWRSKVGRVAAIIAARKDMGRGFGSAAIASLLDVAFGQLSLHKVWLMVFEKNARARRTWGSLGFVEEGVLRDEYFHEGGWHDMVRMGLLESEWPAP
jgi:RimJ/RimL family protein N-acetyltransferase